MDYDELTDVFNVVIFIFRIKTFIYENLYFIYVYYVPDLDDSHTYQ